MKDKTFREVVGTVPSGSVKFYNEDKKRILEFDLKSDETLHFKTNEKKTISKFGQLYGFSYQKLLSDLEDDKATINNTEDFIKNAVKDSGRTVVALVHGIALVNIVSERHKQLPMTEINQMIDDVVGGLEGVQDRGVTDTEGSYERHFQVGQTSAMSLDVDIDYGRNDARGRASIRFSGGGHIFVCSNMIIPYIHKELRVSTNLEAIQKPKIIHTLKVTEHTKANVIAMFNKAQESAVMLGKKLDESKTIKMERVLQKYAIKLIQSKHKVGGKWVESVLKRLQEEDETLYGLSQALTYTGTRADADYMKRRLCEVGGQVVLLGKELIPLLEKNLKEHNVPLAEVRRE